MFKFTEEQCKEICKSYGYEFVDYHVENFDIYKEYIHIIRMVHKIEKYKNNHTMDLKIDLNTNTFMLIPSHNNYIPSIPFKLVSCILEILDNYKGV